MPLENQGGPATASPPPAATTQQTVTIPLEQLQAFTSIQARLAEMEAAAAQPSRKPPSRSRPASWPRRAKSEEALRMLREQSEQAVQRRAAEVRPDRGAGQAVRPGRRGLPDPGRAQPRPGRRRAARPSLAEPVRGRCPGRVLRRAHADVPDGRRFRLAAARPAGVRPLPPGVEPRGGRPPARRSRRPRRRPPARHPRPQPRNMGEAVILHMQSIQKAQGDARANMNLPMGLKAAR